MIYIKDNKRYSEDALRASGFVDHEQRLNAGYSVLRTQQPEFNPYTHYLEDSGNIDNGINWAILPLDDAMLSVRLDEYRKMVSDRLRSDTRLQIAKGFKSAALGEPHIYDSDKVTDQINIIGAASSTESVMFTCTNLKGEKQQQLHTPEQMRTVLNDAVKWVSANRTDLWAMLEAITNAVDIAAIDEVVK